MRRSLGLLGASSINIITMIGIGPLITIPLVLAALGGSLSLLGWIAGAVVALCDGFVWSELASRFPGSGGTYVYLREAFGSQTFGRGLAFLFNWQFLLYAPCLIATGAIGFADYAGYLFPTLANQPLSAHLIAAGLCLLTTALLFRRTSAVSTTGIMLAVLAAATLIIVTIAAFRHPLVPHPLALSAPIRVSAGLLAGFATALYIALYDYVGYSAAALLGDEVREPSRTIPRAVIISVLLVAILYLALQIGVLGAVPWRSLLDAHGVPTAESQYLASSIVAAAWGTWPARVITLLILVTAFASLYGNLLGFSRIPFAAARDGAFIQAFAHLHPRLDIPDVALVAIGVGSLIASFFPLDMVIAFLTAGIVLVQGVAQVVAVIHLRLHANPAPFPMPAFPLPALVAAAGWTLAFVFTGVQAITLSLVWLLIGTGVFLGSARKRAWWPFAAMLLVAMVAAQPAQSASRWSTWQTARIVNRAHTYILEVHGKPFFLYGAAFFYERIPAAEWRDDLLAYKKLGINTIDLYVMWNWHEPHAHVVDFNGATNPRRNLDRLLTIIRQLGFKVILRPGPVIRNEWRNGGYPAWLLRNRAYRMPLHDILEGRYPATATLQNAHADAAASEWLANSVHLRNASAWLQRVLRHVAPWSHEIIAIALDDDQGAYIDNDTWPAPHWHAYIAWLKAQAQSVVGPRVPLFINTYQMKVTASAPVWAWGNWYQSDAFRIGRHDLAQLEFSTGLLQTQRRNPVMASEFQAGWLQGANEIAPRPAAPSNTTLALHDLFEFGAHGIVDFPVQDTRNPAGWEAPWANWVYAWDAAYGLRSCGISPCAHARFEPTARFGEFVQQYGPLLATLQPKSDVEIAWLVDAYDPALMNNDRIAHLAALTIQMQQSCRRRALTCRLVDVSADTLADLRHTHYLLVERTGFPLRFTRAMQRRLAQLRHDGVTLVDSPAAAIAAGASSSTGGLRDAALLLSPNRMTAILDLFNPRTQPRTTQATVLRLHHRQIRVPALYIPAGSARDLLIDAGSASVTPIRLAFVPEPTPTPTLAGSLTRTPCRPGAHAFLGDPYSDGEGAIVMQNCSLRIVLLPRAGARIVVFEDRINRRNFATSIGLLRDDIVDAASPSRRDYIAAYTHPLPTGTFNRRYHCRILSTSSDALVRCSYHAPDLAALPVLFTRTLRLGTQSSTLNVSLRASAAALSISALAPTGLNLTLEDPGSEILTMQNRSGYRLATLRYGANQTTRLRLTLQGAPGSAANPR